MAKQKRVLGRFSMAPVVLEGKDWLEARYKIQQWIEVATSILDQGATESNIDSHQGLNDLQGGNETERYHLTVAQHSYLSGHQGASDPHTQYQKETEKGAANGYASLDADALVPEAQLPSQRVWSWMMGD